MSALYSTLATMIDAQTRAHVTILLFGDLQPGDTQAYVCSGCHCVTPWRTGHPAPKVCDAGCQKTRLVFAGTYLNRAIEIPAPGFTWRPMLSADDVVRLIAALGALTASLQQHIAETDGAPDDDDRCELAAIDELQARLSELRGESTT